MLYILSFFFKHVVNKLLYVLICFNRFLVPGAKQQLVVDRMAKYVVKNGNDFETVVKEKRESRFDFVLPVHKYNDYYEYKKACYEMVRLKGLILCYYYACQIVFIGL